jgi:hypothetical protein
MKTGNSPRYDKVNGMTKLPEGPGNPGVSGLTDGAAGTDPGPIATAPAKDPAAQALGQKGGLKRAQTMSPERRSEIARLAAKRRWQSP